MVTPPLGGSRTDELRARAIAAEEKVGEMNRLLQVASHELRTPLSGVKGFASTLLDYYDRLSEDERQEYIRGILNASHQLEILVADILTYSRIEGGVFQLNLSRVALGAFLKSAVEAHRVAAPVHEIKLSVAEPDPEVRVDTVRLLQVVDNLLDNAVRHGESPVTVAVSNHNDEAIVSVTDEGPGVPTAALRDIFEPFVRVRNPGRRETQGTGLGLSVCKGIVEKHGGTIWAERTASGGCRIAFTLPLKPTGAMR